MPINHPHANRRNDVAPEEEIEPPKIYEPIGLNEAVIESFPVAGTKVISSHRYGRSLWGGCAKITTKLLDGTIKTYFLKEAKGPSAFVMCEGEFESIKAINSVSPTLAPKPWIWGKYKEEDSYFMLTDFREVGQQPPDPVKFTARLAGLHKSSVSPTGKFGFHTTTCHGTITQVTDLWEQSWAVLYRKQLAHMFAMDLEKHGRWPEFEQLCDITLNKVIPRLLEPLQSDGRSIKPCLLHGDCWDENTATDQATGEPFIFDAGSFYGHNEYDIGNWRALRHRLSESRYVESYKENFEPSEPSMEEVDWNGRNLLYSLRFNTGTSILIDKCGQREAKVTHGFKGVRRQWWNTFSKNLVSNVG
ncbi:hypothetical protein MGYG_05380 [Nannizzia gypsea CBS 118893]|uniref:protein-ribulosamine 3-kinase n=1 Tax=Arthroderma gypseum (strain ATCC MYA-4604 / CBS 118893) TaxID=535722 RepID=E4UVQ7_ARTGP|nr:hypothetical protein MGYG_05380 [Nannizzia gypsea CBS 118893]EFR02384.1 hypothetical protein MGYG_05380 [Nannizzia gypsea CBS 118893]